MAAIGSGGYYYAGESAYQYHPSSNQHPQYPPNGQYPLNAPPPGSYPPPATYVLHHQNSYVPHHQNSYVPPPQPYFIQNTPFGAVIPLGQPPGAHPPQPPGAHPPQPYLPQGHPTGAYPPRGPHHQNSYVTPPHGRHHQNSYVPPPQPYFIQNTPFGAVIPLGQPPGAHPPQPPGAHPPQPYLPQGHPTGAYPPRGPHHQNSYVPPPQPYVPGAHPPHDRGRQYLHQKQQYCKGKKSYSEITDQRAPEKIKELLAGSGVVRKGGFWFVADSEHHFSKCTQEQFKQDNRIVICKWINQVPSTSPNDIDGVTISNIKKAERKGNIFQLLHNCEKAHLGSIKIWNVAIKRLLEINASFEEIDLVYQSVPIEMRDTLIKNTILQVYYKYKKTEKSLELWKEIETSGNANITTNNIMIKIFHERGSYQEAVNLYNKMLSSGVVNIVTKSTMLQIHHKDNNTLQSYLPFGKKFKHQERLILSQKI